MLKVFRIGNLKTIDFCEKVNNNWKNVHYFGDCTFNIKKKTRKNKM